MIALFAEQQIEGKAGHTIGHGLSGRILLLIENLAISAALLAGVANTSIAVNSQAR